MPPKQNKPPRKTRAQREAERRSKDEEDTRLRTLHESQKRALHEHQETSALEERVRLRNLEVQRFVAHRERMDGTVMAGRDDRLRRRRGVVEEERRWEDTLACRGGVGGWSADGGVMDVLVGLNACVAELEECGVVSSDDIGAFCDGVYRLQAAMGAIVLQEMDTCGSGTEAVVIERDATSRLHTIVQRHTDLITNRCLYLHRTSEQSSSTSEGARPNPHNQSLLTARGSSSPFTLDVIRANQTIDDTGTVGIIEASFPTAIVRAKLTVRTTHPPARKRPEYYAVQFGTIPFEPRPEDRYLHGHPIVIGGIHRLRVLNPYPPPRTTGYRTVRLRTDTGEHAWECNPPGEFGADGDLSIECEFIVPEGIVPSESVGVVRVVEGEGGRLAVEPIGDSEYDRGRNAVSFRLFDPWVNLALVLPATLDLPYRNWSVGPVVYADGPAGGSAVDDGAEDVVEVCLTTPRFDVVVQIRGPSCVLTKPDLPQLQHLLGEPLSPGQLLSALSHRGIHLLPCGAIGNGESGVTDQDTRTETEETTTTEIEDRFCDDVGLLATAFVVRASAHNARMDCNRGVYQIKESDALTCGGGTDPFPMHLLLMEVDIISSSAVDAPGADVLPERCGNVQCRVLEAQEDSGGGTMGELDAMAVKESTESSISPLFCLAPISSAESVVRVRESCPLVSHTLKLFLKLTRPLRFCRFDAK